MPDFDFFDFFDGAKRIAGPTMRCVLALSLCAAIYFSPRFCTWLINQSIHKSEATVQKFMAPMIKHLNEQAKTAVPTPKASPYQH